MRITLLDPREQPVAGEPYRIVASRGKPRDEKLDESGVYDNIYEKWYKETKDLPPLKK